MLSGKQFENLMTVGQSDVIDQWNNEPVRITIMYGQTNSVITPEGMNLQRSLLMKVQRSNFYLH